MKKLFTTMLSICAGSMLFAQTIPNASFENWTRVGSHYNPNQWGTLNDYTALGGITCSRTTSNPLPPANGGISYISLSTRSIGGLTTAGIAVSGIIDSFSLSPMGGFICNTKPAKLKGKHMVYISDALNDYAFISVLFTKHNFTTEMNDTIGYTIKKFKGQLSSWADFSIDLDYSSNVTNPTAMPDTCLIILSSSGETPKLSSYLHIDLLAFEGTYLGIKENSDINSYSVFPNPANDKLNIYCNMNTSSPITVCMEDIQGKLISRSQLMMGKGENHLSIDVSDINKGIYFVRLSTENSNMTKKVIIE